MGLHDEPANLWQRNARSLTTGEEYIDSLRARGLRVHYLGERIKEPVDHPVVRPSINALARTYDLAVEQPALATAWSSIAGQRVNRFLHVAESADDVVMQNKMQRRLGQDTGTCFQRCVGMDAVASLHSVTFDLDDEHPTDYHQRFLAFLARLQRHNLVLAGGMTDPKGDRSKPPHQQADPDLFLHVSGRNERGLFIRGAKAHMTGGWNQHWIAVLPTMNLREDDRDYAVCVMVPGDADGITYIYGRQASDTRAMEPGTIDQGNAQFGGQEVLVHFDDVFVPWEHVLMDGEYEFAQTLVSRFTAYHRASYVCKTGLGDVMVGAAAQIADDNGVPNVSHIKDKLVEMTHLNETIYSSSIASAHEASQLPSGIWMNDEMLSNVCKHNVTRFPYEIARLAQDLAGGIVVTMPSEADFRNEEVGPLIDKLLAGRADVPTENRMRILRLIENLTLGRNAVGYLTESLHGAGSPQAQRIQIARGMDVDTKKAYARRLAGIDTDVAGS
jgi:4-hydroxybutyryl-CoA dehydratase / vinylacetyl-CoA-Delta-isomerase